MISVHKNLPHSQASPVATRIGVQPDQNMQDPRTRLNGCEHKFIDILMIAICAIMSDGESWEDASGQLSQ